MRLCQGCVDHLAATGELSMADEAMERWNEKFKAARSALDAAPESPDAHRELASCALNLGDYELARQHDEAAFQLRPGFSWALVGIVVASSFLKDYQRAKGAYERLLELEAQPVHHRVEASFYMGVMEYERGDVARAEQLLDEVINFKVSSEEVYFDRLVERARKLRGR